MNPLNAVQPYLVYIKAAAMLTIILLACAMTHKCTATAYKLDIANMEKSYAQAEAKRQANARQKEQQDRDRIAAIDQEHSKALRGKEHEIDKLRAAVDAGTVRLRVQAKCPGNLPGASAGPGVDPGTGAELDALARQHYFFLRAGIERQHAKLNACQAVLKAERE